MERKEKLMEGENKKKHNEKRKKWENIGKERKKERKKGKRNMRDSLTEEE